jgi:HlyD family secretion protein
MVVSFTVDAFPEESFQGRVRQIRNAPTTVQNVVTYDVVVDVDNDALLLRPGMTANVNFVVDERQDVLRITNAALRFRPPEGLSCEVPDGRREPGGEAVAEGSGAGEGAGRRRDGPSTEAAWAANDTRQRGESQTAAADAGRSGEGAEAEEGSGRQQGGGSRRTLWVLRNGAPQCVSVRLGLTDGTHTEVLDGDLAEGDALITSASGPGVEEAPAQQQGGRRGGFRMF